MSIEVVVLCGGEGRRLWPASRADRPKPLLELGGGSLLRATVDRFAGLGPVSVVCGVTHADAVASELPGIPVVVEHQPSGTGPAIRRALSGRNPDAIVLVTPADHAVADPAALITAILAAEGAAAAGWLVTFGVTPTRAEPGFGWIVAGEPISAGGPVRRIARFVEKPAVDVARVLLAAGGLWNAGLFLVRAGTALEALDRHAPGEPPGAFDRQVLEKTDRGAVMPVDCGWSDLGTWPAVIAAGSAGVSEVTASPGATTWSDGPAIAVLGAPDVTVVASAGGVLVAGPGWAERAGEVRIAPSSTLDHGPGWSVERRTLGPGDALVVGPTDRATVVTGPTRGALLPAGRFVAGGRCVVVIVSVRTA